MSVNWNEVNWVLGDIDIAEEVGVSRQRVHQVRTELGKPKGLSRKKRETQARQEKLIDIAVAGGSELTSGEYADEVGISLRTLRCDARGIGYSLKDLFRSERPGVWEYDWDAVDWEGKFDSQIARELGTAPAVVTQTRKRQGRPDGPDGRRVSPRRHNLGVDAKRVEELSGVGEFTRVDAQWIEE